MIRLAALVLTLWAGSVTAQEYSPADVQHGQKDYHVAQTGSYNPDPARTAVMASMLQLGFSFSVPSL